MKTVELIELTESEVLGRLTGVPEDGMGYQFGTRKVRHSGSKTNGVFLAGSYFLPFDAKATEGADGLPDLSKGLLLEAAQPVSQKGTLYVFETVQTQGALAVAAVGVPTAGGATATTPPFATRTVAGEKYYRFSAFAMDRRILSDGSLAANSYATSETDIKVVPNGLAAVGRYALPTRTSAKYVFEISPAPGTLIFFGTVTPAFGMAGGGVEVFFPLGTTAGTVNPINPIPEK